MKKLTFVKKIQYPMSRQCCEMSIESTDFFSGKCNVSIYTPINVHPNFRETIISAHEFVTVNLFRTQG